MLVRDHKGAIVEAIVRNDGGGTHMTRDVFITEKAGAVGPNSTATNTTFNKLHGDPLTGLDRATLLTELAMLRSAMQVEASGSVQYAALSAISEAEDAAKQGDSVTLVSKLKAAGSWALDTATKIGVSVATDAIKKASGLG